MLCACPCFGKPNMLIVVPTFNRPVPRATIRPAQVGGASFFILSNVFARFRCAKIGLQKD